MVESYACPVSLGSTDYFSNDPAYTLTLKVFTIKGKVALNSMVCRSVEQKARSCSITGVNSGESSLSASSMMKVVHAERSATPLLARSSIRPGVPTMMWTVSLKRRMSSLRFVPPVETMIWRLRCFPSVRHTCEVWRASSRVGTNISACRTLLLELTFSSVGMTNAAVFPVPFFALASMSRPVKATGIAASWMGEGFSNPASNMPIISGLEMRRSSKSRPFVAVTSCG